MRYQLRARYMLQKSRVMTGRVIVEEAPGTSPSASLFHLPQQLASIDAQGSRHPRQHIKPCRNFPALDLAPMPQSDVGLVSGVFLRESTYLAQAAQILAQCLADAHEGGSSADRVEFV